MGLIKKLVRLLGPLIFLFILSRMDLRLLAETIADVRLDLLLAAMLLYPVLIMLKAWRWQMLLHRQRIDYGLAPAFVVYNSSLAVGYATPGRLGEFVKALYLRQDAGIPLGQGLSSMLVDRLLDLFLLLITAGVGVSVFSLPGGLSSLAVATLLLVALGPLLILVPAARRRVIALLTRTLSVLSPERYEQETRLGLGDFQQGLEQLLGVQLLIPVGITLLAYGLFYFQCYLTALALGLPISYAYSAFCVSLASLLSLLPISVSGLGVRDATFIALLVPLAITAEMAIGYSLLILLVFNIFGGALGALAWFSKPLK